MLYSAVSSVPIHLGGGGLEGDAGGTSASRPLQRPVAPKGVLGKVVRLQTGYYTHGPGDFHGAGQRIPVGMMGPGTTNGDSLRI